MRVVTMVGLLSLAHPSTPMGVQVVTCVTVGVEMLLYRDHSEPPAVAQRLVVRYVALAGVELVSPRQRAFRLLHHRVLEQRADLVMGLAIFECRELREPSEQGRRDSYVLACSGEVREIFIVLDDPLVHVVSEGTRTPTVSAVFDLTLELRALLL
jgi:hypothetical protein